MTSALFDTFHLTQKDCLLHTRGAHYFEKLQGLMMKVKCWRLGVKIWVEDVWFGAQSPFSSRTLFLGVTSPTSQGPFLPHSYWSGCLRFRTQYTLGMLKNDHSHLLRKMKLKDTCSLDLGLIPGLGRSPGGGKGSPLQYSGLENSMDRIGSKGVGHEGATST